MSNQALRFIHTQKADSNLSFDMKYSFSVSKLHLVLLCYPHQKKNK